MPSVNELAAKICEKMIEEAEELNIGYERLRNGSHVIDTGIRVIGGIQAGLRSIMSCLGGLGIASLASMEVDGMMLPAVEVFTDFPVISLLCQAMGGYRKATLGWLNFEAGSYRAIASGPARALVHEPKELFEMIGYSDSADVAVSVLQSEQYPDEIVAVELASRCRVKTENLYMLVCPPSSMAGSIQVIGRSIENAMLKLRSLNFDARRVRYIHGIAPLPPLGSRSVNVDDMLSYGSVVHLYVDSAEGTDLKRITDMIPSRSAKC
jgi:methenyltetrahydromethanopterin cyclohydrolase